VSEIVVPEAGLKLFTFTVPATSLDAARAALLVPENESVRWVD
jgi:hypothetical protein